MTRARIVAALVAVVMLAAPVSAGAATPSSEATCVGLASAFFGQQGIRDDVAHAIAAGFGIPPGAEVSRFAHVQLGDTAACIANGQG
ncbi:MAG: hypothetical protein WD096_07590 [Actinomycetota bacterium]